MTRDHTLLLITFYEIVNRISVTSLSSCTRLRIYYTLNIRLFLSPFQNEDFYFSRYITII